MTPAEIRTRRGNVVRICSSCDQSFEVPEGYPLPADWRCSWCEKGGPPCEHASVAFDKCEQCGCVFK